MYDDVRYMTKNQILDLLDHSDPHDVAEFDYVDVDTGEVYVEKGQTFGDSNLHPWKKFDKLLVKSPQLGVNNNDEIPLKLVGKYGDSFEHVELDYRKAIDEFAANYGSDFPSDIDVTDSAWDIADNFFFEYPDWKMWSEVLMISKEEMKSAAAESLIS
jgi:hypothetical protein